MARRLPLRLVVLAVAGPLGLAACSLLTGLDADYTLASDVSGDDASTGSDRDEPDGADARPTGDGSTPVDAGPFCAQHKADPGVVFCQDFENSLGSEANGFDDSSGPASGKLEVLPGTGVGGSLALRAKASGPSTSGNVYVHKRLDEADGAVPSFDEFNEHVLSFAFAFDDVTKLYTSLIGSIGYGSLTSLTRIGLSDYMGDGTNNVDVSDPPGGLNGPSVKMAVDEWRRVTVTLKRGARTQPYTATVLVEKLDGTSPVEVYRATSAFDGGVLNDGGTGPVHLLLGSYFTSAVPDGGGVSNRIDDVLYRRFR